MSHSEPMKTTIAIVALPSESRKWKRPFISGLRPMNRFTTADSNRPVAIIFRRLTRSARKPLMNRETP